MMGYTHYWHRPDELEAAPFEAWTDDVRRILANLPAHTRTAGGYHSDDPLLIAGGDGDGPALVTRDRVSFNGAGDEFSHETFGIERVFKPHYVQRDERGWLFDFCKTARKPYDLAVTASLIRFAFHFPEACTVASDGDVSEWEEGRKLCASLFGFAMVPLSS